MLFLVSGHLLQLKSGRGVQKKGGQVMKLLQKSLCFMLNAIVDVIVFKKCFSQPQGRGHQFSFNYKWLRKAFLSYG